MLKYLCHCEEPRSGDDGVPADIIPAGEGPRRGKGKQISSRAGRLLCPSRWSWLSMTH